MGARGKVRRRANGQLARGRTSKPQPMMPFAPIMVEFRDNPIPEVPLHVLSTAIGIYSRHLPLDAASIAEMDERDPDLADEIYATAEGEIKEAVEPDIYNAVVSRTLLLHRFLAREGRNFFDVQEDGGVAVDQKLLAHAATSALNEHPDEEIEWP